jgi:hypothetical protein
MGTTKERILRKRYENKDEAVSSSLRDGRKGDEGEELVGGKDEGGERESEDALRRLRAGERDGERMVDVVLAKES